VGVLTEATMQLQKEIAALRQVRVTLRTNLVRQTGDLRSRVSALCAGFASDRAAAHRAWFGPTRFRGWTAERHPQRRPAEEPKVKAPAEEQPAIPNAKSRRDAPAKHVSRAAARAPVAPLSPSPKPHSKKSKKH